MTRATPCSASLSIAAPASSESASLASINLETLAGEFPGRVVVGRAKLRAGERIVGGRQIENGKRLVGMSLTQHADLHGQRIGESRSDERRRQDRERRRERSCGEMLCHARKMDGSGMEIKVVDAHLKRDLSAALLVFPEPCRSHGNDGDGVVSLVTPRRRLRSRMRVGPPI